MSALAKRLAEYAAGYAVGAFDWQRANCCHFAAGWVTAVRGAAPMEGLPDTPSAKEARRLIRALGGIRQAVTKQTGLQQIAAEFAQVGDIVLRQIDGSRIALGICAGRTAMHVDEAGAIVHLPVAGAVCAWRVVPC